jgi:hypothetical protein
MLVQISVFLNDGMNKLKSVLTNSFYWTLLALAITLIFRFIFYRYPQWVENFYYKTIYRAFRVLWDSVIAWFPVPLFYIWLGILLYLLISFTIQFFFKKDRKLKCLKIAFMVLAIHFIWFYWTWGYNYARQNLGERWNIIEPVKEDDFLKEFYTQTNLIDSMREVFKTEINHYQFNADNLEKEIRDLAIEFQNKNGFLAFNGVRCRNLSLNGILLIWSTSGVYLPFVGESQFDGGLHILSKPFTMAHELCHGMGWTHEGDCNFMAYLICRQSTNPFIRYSGELNYWRYLYANASRIHPEEFNRIRSGLNPDILNDLKEINAANDRYPEIFPELRAWFYDWYLKKHGIASGDKSYSEIIEMVINYKLKINH